MTVLVVTSHDDATADYLCARMGSAGVGFVRLNTESAPTSCELHANPSGISLTIDRLELRPQAIDAVWYRRPRPVAPGHQGDLYERQFAADEWAAAIEGFLAHVPFRRWINHPRSIAGASSKLEQLARAASVGLSVPEWTCTVQRDLALEFWRAHPSVVAKPLYAGYIERDSPRTDSVIYTTGVEESDLRAWNRHLGAPTLFQARVFGDDVRVSLVDDDVHAVRMQRKDGAVDIRRSNMEGVTYSEIVVPDAVQRALLGLTRSYGLRFAAIDMMARGDTWHFLEINPNGQWAWLDIVGGAAIYRAFLSAFTAPLQLEQAEVPC